MIEFVMVVIIWQGPSENIDLIILNIFVGNFLRDFLQDWLLAKPAEDQSASFCPSR